MIVLPTTHDNIEHLGSCLPKYSQRVCVLDNFSAGVVQKNRSDFELTCDGSGWVSDSDGPFTKGLMLTSSHLFYLRPGKGKTNLVILPSNGQGENE